MEVPKNFPLTGSRQKVLDGNKYMQDTLVKGVCKHGGRSQHVQTHFVQMMDLVFGQTLLQNSSHPQPKTLTGIQANVILKISACGTKNDLNFISRAETKHSENSGHLLT